MGFRFRRNISPFPGVRINLSKGGISTSFGGPGATVNIGKRGLRGTVGMPGTGLSFTQLFSKPAELEEAPEWQDEALPSGVSSITLPKEAAIAVLATVALLLAVSVVATMHSEPASNANSIGIIRNEVKSDSVVPNNIKMVTVAAANCRSGPSKSNRVVVQLFRGRRVEVQEQQGEWYRVNAGRLDCWAHTSLMV